MVKIRFIAQGSNALVGGFGPGDVANVGEALAQHLVDEAGVARYMEKDEPRKLVAKVGKPVKKAKVVATDEPAVSPAPTSDEAVATDPDTTAGN